VALLEVRKMAHEKEPQFKMTPIELQVHTLAVIFDPKSLGIKCKVAGKIRFPYPQTVRPYVFDTLVLADLVCWADGGDKKYRKKNRQSCLQLMVEITIQWIQIQRVC
jgi:hypothetical protein